MSKSLILAIVFLGYSMACVAAVGFLSTTHLTTLPLNLSKPNFREVEDTNARKQAFFDFLAPMLQDQNQRILQVRERLKQIKAEYDERGKLSRRSRHYLQTVQQNYLLQDEALETEALINRLLRRVDIIPVPLALAQAASESGWGTSRFAHTANNFFGQWCYVEGCGIVPNRRAAGAVHEVADFPSVRESVNSYFANLNTYYAYQQFRAQREKVRQAGRRPRTADLIPTLLNYSERREAYLEDLRQIIRVNQLTRFAPSEQS